MGYDADGKDRCGRRGDAVCVRTALVVLGHHAVLGGPGEFGTDEVDGRHVCPRPGRAEQAEQSSVILVVPSPNDHS
ncbi:MAG: hypothetical protein IIT75_01160 [Candidatus Methanomethylophilus sp.]|nr:hypothetical protein [Methanomethylophilus sp.]